MLLGRSSKKVKNKHIVIVEDHQDMAEMFSMALQEDGMSTALAADGASGLDLIRSEEPDGVILDIQLPKMNGYEVCAQMQSDGALKDIPVMIVTGLIESGDPNSDEEWRDRMKVADFMSKPFSTEEMSQRVLKMIDGV